MSTLLLAVLLLTAPTPQSARAPQQGAPPAAVSAPSAAAPELAASRARADSLYISVLERTNQQLRPWSNPYGLFIVALGVLSSIATIVVGCLLFTQSREYRDLIKDSIARYESVLAALVQDRMEDLQAHIESKPVEARRELATAHDDKRGVIEARIWREAPTLRTRGQQRESPDRPRRVGALVYSVGAAGLEPATSWSQTRRATGLRHAPKMLQDRSL
jgi:hypothetical protein